MSNREKTKQQHKKKIQSLRNQIREDCIDSGYHTQTDYKCHHNETCILFFANTIREPFIVIIRTVTSTTSPLMSEAL